MKRFLAILSLVALTGCSTPAWLPWSAQHKANAAEKAEAKRDSAKDKLVDAAQKTAHEAQMALAAAPASRPVEVAKEATDATVTALDQAAGPLTVEEANAVRKQVTDLLSENAALRKQGEALRAESRADLVTLSEKLATTQAKLDSVNEALPAALRREAELADRYRFLRNLAVAVGLLALVGYAAAFYVRFAYGGIPSAIGAGLSALRAKHPEAGDLATSVFDSYLNRHEQAKIRAKS